MKTRPSPLRLRRVAAGLRIADVAYATGLAPTRISQIERGEWPPARRDELALINRQLEDALAAARLDPSCLVNVAAPPFLGGAS